MILAFNPWTAFAQEPVNLQFLIFDPVPLQASAPNDAPDSNPAADAEFQTTPKLAQTVDLASWMTLNRITTAANPDAFADDIARYEKTIAELELEGGPFEPRMSQELLALGSIYFQTGNYTRALEVFDQASHVDRVNHGLFSLSQIPIIENSIKSLLAQGDLLAADEQQEYLFYLQRKNFENKGASLIPALTQYAEWNVFAFNTRITGLSPGNIDVSHSGDTSVANMESFRTSKLINALNVYQTIINILHNNLNNTDSRLPDYEKQLALTNYLFATHFNFASSEPSPGTFYYNSSQISSEGVALSNNTLGYRQGREALERRVELIQQGSANDSTALIQAKIDLGDWQLISNKRTEALEIYTKAYAEAVAAGVPKSTLQPIFNPDLPEMVPVFISHSYSRKALDIPDNLLLEYKGYIDVEFSLNRFGFPAQATVLEKSADTPAEVEDRLLRKIKRGQFRPRIDNDVARETDLVRARYYYAY